MQTAFISPHHQRRLWLLFLLLSPLGYVGGQRLMSRQDPNLRVGMAIDRAAAVAIAERLAVAKGVPALGWSSFCKVEDNNSRYFYYRLRRDGDVAGARRFAPEVVVRVLLVAPDRRENFEAEMAPDGHVLGYRRRFAGNRETPNAAPALTEAEDRIVAEAALRDNPAAAAMLADLPLNATPEISVTQENSAPVRRFAWNWPAASLPELERQFVVAVQGRTVIREGVETKIEPKFAAQRLESNPVGLIAFGITYGLIVAVIVIFGIYRFAKRAQQKEVSYGRIALMAVVTPGIFIIFLLQTDVAAYSTASQPGLPVPFWIGNLFAIITYILMGLLLGLAYGSGEGDIREAYPGKLTSLDALLTGRPFSRNVARSVLIGAAFGGWMLLGEQLMLRPWAHQPTAGMEITNLEMLMARSVRLLTVTGWGFYPLLAVTVSILLPLPFLHRRFKDRRVITVLMAIAGVVACLLSTLYLRPWAAAILAAAVYAAGMLVAFFNYGLLTAVVSLGAPVYFTQVTHLLAQPAPSLHGAGTTSASIALVLLALELVLLFKGRLYGDEEVRPKYARFLAERLALQAEVSAAREAQIRLLPGAPPQIPGLAVAAHCRPAHEVGGDFYDFFDLQDGKLGIFMAEGGGRGLASAMSIAFAKGYLMPHLRGAAQQADGRDDSPTEVVRSLQARLSAMLSADEMMGFAFAVIDTSDGTLRYARTGPYPRVLRGGPKDARPVPIEEREIRFMPARDAGSAFSVTEGRTELNAGDTLLLYTDGLAKSWSETRDADQLGLWSAISAHRERGHLPPPEALRKLMAETTERAHHKNIEDDLTAVIVRFAGCPASIATRQEGA